jgi:hypothetical protein
VVRTRDGQSHELGKPGTALLLTGASGSVSLKGPFTWDGSTSPAAGTTSLPRYGANFWLDPRSAPAPDSRLDLNDQLNAIVLRSALPPQPQPNCTTPSPCP